MTSNEPGPVLKPRRRRFRLSLRAFLAIPVLAAAAAWWYVQTVERGLGPVMVGIKAFVSLEIVVLDDVTGTPIEGAKVELPVLNPSWRDRADLLEFDLRSDLYPEGQVPRPFLTDRGGRAAAARIVHMARERKHRVYGLLPVVGKPEIVFSPTDGLRVSADGYATWVTYLDDLRKENGRGLDRGAPMRVVVRLKPAAPTATTIP